MTLLRSELSGAPDHDARLAILLRHVTRHPEIGALRWELYDHYMVIGELEAAQRQLDEGLRLGAIEFVIEQARAHPESIDDARLAQLERENAVLAAGVMLARGDGDRGWARLREVFAGGGGASYRASALARDAWLDVTTLALEHGRADVAAWMAVGLRDASDRFTAKTALTDAVEPLLVDLVTVAEELPSDYVAALARGLRARTDRGRAEPVLAVRRTGDPEGPRVYGLLRERSRPLAATFREALVGPVPTRGGIPWQSPFQRLRFTLGAFAILALILYETCRPRVESPLQRAAQPRPPAGQQQRR